MKSFKYALHGFLTALRSEKNLRFHVAAAVLVTAAGIFLNLAIWEWAAVVCCMGLVVAMELLNTAIEVLCNAVTKEYHPLIKNAKDIAAAAVLVSAAAAGITGFIIFFPKIFQLLT